MLSTTKPTQDEPDDIDLRAYAQFLGTYWLLIAACAIAGAALGLFVASRVPVRYQATAMLAVAAAQSDGTPAQAFPLTPATTRALLTNTTLVAETLSELAMPDGGLTAASFVASALDVQPLPATNLIRLSVTLADPAQAREAARILSEKAVALSRRVDQDGAAVTRDAIKRQVDEAAQRLDTLGARLLSQKSAAQLDVLSAETDSHLKAHRTVAQLTLDLEAEKARLERLEADLAKHPPTLSAPGGLTVPLVRPDSSPAPRAHPLPGASVDPFANPVHSLLQYDIARSRATISSLERRRREIERTAGGTVKQLNELYRRRLELARLEGEYDVAMRVHGELVARYEDARTRVVAGTPQLQIVEAPLQPDHPLPRRRVRSASLGAVVGAGVGLIAAVLIRVRGRTRP